MSLSSVDVGRCNGKLRLLGLAVAWLSWFIIPSDLFSQSFPMFNGTSSTCQGALLDTGGQGASGYSNNENITYTICPDTPGGAISLNFITANLSTAGNAPIDNITIFDGNSANAPQLGSWTGTALQGQVVSASAANPTGCLTVRFRSNNTGTGVFAATITCYQPCIRPTAVASHGAIGPLKICPGESVTFNSSASFAAPGFSIASRRWDLGDGTILNNAPESVSHTYAQPGGYTAQLYLLDNNGCASTNTVDLIVLVGTPPSFNGTSATQTGCVGETLCLTGAVTGTTWTEPPASSVGAGIFLPDQVGTCFTSTITLDQFAPGAVLTNANGLQGICLNMEHSFIGDLVISIISPTGQTVTLHQQGGGGTFLGVPVDNDATPNAQGTCWAYCWSPAATNGTWVDNAGGTLPSGTYESLNSLNGLIGSQLNGTWTIQICDLWASDNGFVCDWQLDFAPTLYDDLIEFTPSYGAACDSSSWSGPNISSTTADCNGICVTPGAPGPYTYTYTVTDDFGCTYNTTSTVNMIPGPVVNAGLDAISCTTWSQRDFWRLPDHLQLYPYAIRFIRGWMDRIVRRCQWVQCDRHCERRSQFVDVAERLARQHKHSCDRRKYHSGELYRSWVLQQRTIVHALQQHRRCGLCLTRGSWRRTGLVGCRDMLRRKLHIQLDTRCWPEQPEHRQPDRHGSKYDPVLRDCLPTRTSELHKHGLYYDNRGRRHSGPWYEWFHCALCQWSGYRPIR
jgi:subtilisin-like proprotein convertase family protein